MVCPRLWMLSFDWMCASAKHSHSTMCTTFSLDCMYHFMSTEHSHSIVYHYMNTEHSHSIICTILRTPKILPLLLEPFYDHWHFHSFWVPFHKLQTFSLLYVWHFMNTKYSHSTSWAILWTLNILTRLGVSFYKHRTFSLNASVILWTPNILTRLCVPFYEHWIFSL